MNIASLVKHVGLPGFTVNPTKTVKVMANAVDQAYVLLTAGHAIGILTVAGRNTVVNEATWPTFVVQAVSESIARLIVIVEMTTAVNATT